MQSVEIRIAGMSCGGCVASITRQLQAQRGVVQVAVTLDPPVAAVQFDSALIELAALTEVIEDAGFDVVS